jgi:hypothetical protein
MFLWNQPGGYATVLGSMDSGMKTKAFDVSMGQLIRNGRFILTPSTRAGLHLIIEFGHGMVAERPGL